MAKGKSIWVDEETYSKLKAIAEELNIRSIAELLRLIAGTHPSIRLFIDNPEEFYKKVIEGIRYALGTSKIGSMQTIEKPQQRSRSSYTQHRLTSSQEEAYEIRLNRAIKYASKILSEQGYITKEQLEKVGKKFDVNVWDIVSALGVYEKEKDKYYPAE